MNTERCQKQMTKGGPFIGELVRPTDGFPLASGLPNTRRGNLY